MRTDFARLVAIFLSLAAGRVAVADWRVWTVTETRHVLRSEPPGRGLAVNIAAARNEWVSFQILVRSDEPVKAVRVESGELHRPGAAVLRTSESRLYRQHQLHLEIGTYRNDTFQADWYPDPLIPFERPRAGKKSEAARFRAIPFDVPANETHGLWVDLYVPADTPPGEYRGAYRVIAEGGMSVDVPVTLTVWDFALPQTPTLVTALGSPAQRMRGYARQRARAGKEPEPSDWQAVETQCAQLLSEHHLNATPSAEMLRPVVQSDGSFRIPSEQIRALRRFVDRYHVNALRVPHPSGVIKDPQAERDKLRAWLAAFDRAAKELDRPHIVFFVYLKDEPNTQEDYQYVQKWGRAIREAKSAVQVMVVEQTWTEPGKGGADSAWGDLYGAVDIWCPLFSLHHQDSAAERQALGETVWAYTALCQGPPTPWWHIDYPLLNYRAPAWMAWRDHMKGLLYWGGMSYWRETDDPWLHAPVYTGRGALQQGDRGIRFNGEGSLVYPARPAGHDGIVPTIRLKALRDAIEDYEYMAILDHLGKSAEADKIVRRLTESWFQWDKDPAAYEKARAELAALIVAASSTSPAQVRAQWQEIDGTRIPVPPAEHPRLYLRAEHVTQLPQRLKDPVLQPAVERLQAQAKRSPQSKLEWDALQYVVTHDEALGRAVIEAALPLLQKSELGNRQDACRKTGRMMVTGAIVYDWCYSLLTPDEKQAFIKELIRLAKTQECGYPPTGQGSVTGHASEAMIMRDMLSAGIAIYDEFPEMYRLAAGRFLREHLPVRNWFYPGHAYHQGDSYGPHRYSWDTYPLWIFDRLGAGNVYNPEQRFVPYLWVYTTRPDGQRLRAGDTFACSARRGRPWSQYIGTLLTASYYGDGILLDQFRRQGGSGGNETIFEVLWRDTSLAPKPIATLPLSWYSGSPFGWTVARTGWDENAVIAEMKVNEYNFVNHQHLDAGAFQVYYKGALAMDSGIYQGGSAGGYGSSHCLNYSWRTIAHNSLLVYDPNEEFGRRGYGNDGGQRLPHRRSEARNLNVLLAPENGYRTGKVLAHGFGPNPQTPDFTLLQGDITDAYGKKVRQVTRSFVFLNLHNAEVPAAMVVFDRVVSVDPAFRKYWLLHTLEEPRIASASAVVDCTQHGNRGRLILDTLLPSAANADLAKVGGPGKEFWVFGQNYANDVDPKRLERTSIEAGVWRIELSPKAATAEDLFLNVMQVTDRRSPSRWPVRRLEAGERVGCIIEGPEATWAVLMRRDSRRSAEPVTFTVPGDRPSRILVTDLSPGQWHARREGSAETRDLAVGEDCGTAWFEGPVGAWTLSR